MIEGLLATLPTQPCQLLDGGAYGIYNREGCVGGDYINAGRKKKG